MIKGIVFPKLNGKGLKIGIIRARWNEQVTKVLEEQTVKGLLDSGVKKKDITIIEVPGSYELVFGAKMMLKKNKPDALVCIGTILKGGTTHAEYISEVVTHFIMNLSLKSKTPIVFGVLTCLTEKQALERSIGKESHAYHWGQSAVEMALLKKKKKY